MLLEGCIINCRAIVKADSDLRFYCSENHEWVENRCTYTGCGNSCLNMYHFHIGKNDLKLAKKLIKAGSEHRKFLRQIFCSVDITAPLYWWKEFDNCTVGTVANSTSTMHKLASTPITMNCFEMGDFFEEADIFDYGDYSLKELWDNNIIQLCEVLRKKYIETKNKKYCKELIRLLPESWLQTRTIAMNYENLLNIYHQRKNHKLSEWHKLCEWLENLPYAKELIIGV